MPEQVQKNKPSAPHIKLDEESLGSAQWSGNLNTEKLSITQARSSGSGGQNVNKVATKAQIQFDVLQYDELSIPEREAVLAYVKSHRPSMVTTEDIIITSCQETRSFHENRVLAIQKLEDLITKALTPKKPRIKTKKPRSADEKRLAEKKQTQQKKKSRSERPDFS